MVKDDDGNYHYIHPNDFESESFLTIRYDKQGQAIHHTHDPNQLKRILKGGWTTWFVKIRKKK